MDKENQNLHPNKRLRRESSEHHYNIQGYNYDDSDYWPDSESDNGNLLKKIVIGGFVNITFTSILIEGQ